MRKKAFTLIEVLVTLSIFLILMGMVVGLVVFSFRNFREGEKMLGRDQRQRFCLSRLSREISSLIRATPPNVSFVGKENSFFLSLPKKIIW